MSQATADFKEQQKIQQLQAEIKELETRLNKLENRTSALSKAETRERATSEKRLAKLRWDLLEKSADAETAALFQQLKKCEEKEAASKAKVRLLAFARSRFDTI